MILLEHQRRALTRLEENKKGLLVYHSMGTGKTLIALSALSLFPGKKIIIAPASVQNIYIAEAKKFDLSLDRTLVCSFEKYLRNIDVYMGEYGLVIIDEAHRLRNPDTKLYQQINKLLQNSSKVLLLSGTPEYNQPVDICNLVSLINNQLGLPRTMNEFYDNYIDKRTYTLINQQKICSILAAYVDIYTPTNLKDYPERTDTLIKCPMSQLQYKIYKYLERKLPGWIRKSIYNDIPLSIQNTAKLNFFSSAIRQASDSVNKYIEGSDVINSTKILAAASHLAGQVHEKMFRCIVYSNYIEACLIPYSEYLDHNTIKYSFFTGATPRNKKEYIIERYNSNEPAPQILLMSSTGSEGLNLRGTSLIQIMEPHFNTAKIEQVIHRGIRYLSHSHLPSTCQRVLVEHYISTFPEKWYNKIFHIKSKLSIDEYLHNLSLRKKRLMDTLIDGIIHYSSNKYRDSGIMPY